jgi:hypothetical protein
MLDQFTSAEWDRKLCSLKYRVLSERKVTNTVLLRTFPDFDVYMSHG